MQQPREDAIECYVCCESEPPPRLSQCKCKGRYVHDECLRKLLLVQTEAVCMVCRTPHADVVVREPDEVLRRLEAAHRRRCVVVSSMATVMSLCALGLAVYAIVVNRKVHGG